MKQIVNLVAGGAGFIGSHLCRELLSRGQYVICVDNFFTGAHANIADLRGETSFEVIRHDITESLVVEADRIYNLACPASPQHYQYNPIKTMKTSVVGTMNMLGLATRLRARILQASTSEVYGDPQVHPQPESYWGNVNIAGIRSCYDEGKRAAETLCYDYHRQNQTDIRVVRIFNTYGPNMVENDGRVVSNFVVQALRGEDITIYGDGSQTRSFCFVSDLVRGFLDFMDLDGFIGPMNLGNDQEHTVLQLATRVIELTGSSSKIVHRPLPQDDPLRRKPDLQTARQRIGYEPGVPLDEGLRQTIDYFRRALQN
ncbi:MAG: SDR family oxidoreductase [Leptospirales bacterium]|nr:SDR family oxidoreductase [Leptospirales bacterium]